MKITHSRTRFAFGVPETSIARITGIPAGASVRVIANPEEWARAEVKVGNKVTTWVLSHTGKPGEFALALPQESEFVQGPKVPAFLIIAVAAVLYYGLWPVWWVGDKLKQDYHNYRDMLDQACPS